MSSANARISANRLAFLVAFFLRYRLLFLIVRTAHSISFNSLSINARCCWPSFMTLRAKKFILGHNGRSSSWKPAGSSTFTWSQTNLNSFFKFGANFLWGFLRHPLRGVYVIPTKILKASSGATLSVKTML